MTQHAFTFYADPGHGWLKVTKKQLNLIGMKPEEFSSHYFQRAYEAYPDFLARASKSTA